MIKKEKQKTKTKIKKKENSSSETLRKIRQTLEKEKAEELRANVWRRQKRNRQQL